MELGRKLVRKEQTSREAADNSRGDNEEERFEVEFLSALILALPVRKRERELPIKECP
jgi:hypothetical protein